MELFQIIISLVFGGIIGLLLGFLGGGGSVLTVPVLVYLFGQSVHDATGTSLAIVGSSALIGTFFHSRKKEVRWKTGIAFGLMSMAGSIPGVFLNKISPGNYVLVFFSLLMIGVAVSMLKTKPHSSQQNKTCAPCERYTFKDWLKMLVVGLAVGGLTGFFGVGGGFLIVPALVLVGKFPPHQAVGTSLLIITLTSFSGFLSNLSLGNMNLDVATFFVIGSLFGVISGTKMSGCVSARKLNSAFGIFMIFVAIYMLYLNIFGV